MLQSSEAVVTAGPNDTSSFHVVGKIFDRACQLGSVTSPPIVGPLRNIGRTLQMTPFGLLRIAFVLCATVALTLAAGPAFAHAKLLSEVPAAEETGAASASSVSELRLAFSEELNGAFSKVAVKDPTGAAVGGATVALDPNDSKVLVVTFTTALAEGEYEVDWTAVASDGHKTSGTYKVNVAQ